MSYYCAVLVCGSDPSLAAADVWLHHAPDPSLSSVSSVPLYCRSLDPCIVWLVPPSTLHAPQNQARWLPMAYCNINHLCDPNSSLHTHPIPPHPSIFLCNPPVCNSRGLFIAIEILCIVAASSKILASLIIPHPLLGSTFSHHLPLLCNSIHICL